MQADDLLNGLVLLISAFFLFVPGVLSDFIGLTLLLPPTRKLAIKLLSKVNWKKYASRTKAYKKKEQRPDNIIDIKN